MAAAAVAPPTPAAVAVPQLAHASTSASAPAHAAAHWSRSARTQLFVHAAAHAPRLVVRGADHAVVQALAFPGVHEQREAALGALSCGEGGADVGPLIVAALGHRIVVWARTGTGLWRQHSAFELAQDEDGDVTALDLREGKLLIGAQRSISLWTLDAGAPLQPWRRAWRRRCPQPILAARWSPDGLVFAAATHDDERVLLWACGGKTDERPRPRLRAELAHSRPLRSFAWREAPDSSGQTEALLTTTTDGTIRLWAPVIDTPGQPRLWAAMCSSAMGGAEPSYLAARHVAGALEATKAAYARQTELAAVGLRSDTQREAEAREGAVRRLEAVGEAPDLFLGLSEGNLTLKALANVDRAPPTLHSIYTVLSTPSSLPVLSASLEPLAVPAGAEPSAPAAMLRLQHASYTLAPAAFFEGSGGLLACAPRQVPHAQRIERLLCAPGHERVASLAAGESRIWTACKRGSQRGLQSSDPRHGRIVALAADSYVTLGGERVTLHRSDGPDTSHPLPRSAELAAVLLGDETPVLVTSDASVLQGSSAHELGVKSPSQLVFASAATIFTLGRDGTLESWTRSESSVWTRSSRLDCDVGQVRHAQPSETGLVALASTSSAGSAHLSIWDTRASAFSSGLEHAQDWSADVCALAWAPASFAPLLAVAAAASVTLLAPRRRGINEDVRRSGAARWEAVAHVELGVLACEPIVDVEWLANGQLLVATQAEIHAYGPYLAPSEVHTEDDAAPERPRHIAELAAKQCGPLPDFHPLMLWQLLQWNRLDVAKKVAVLLAKAAQTHEVAGPLRPESLPCDAFFEEQSASTQPGRAAQGLPLFDDAAEAQTGDALEYSSALVADLLKTLESTAVGDLDASEMAQLRVLLRTIDEVNEQRRSLDDNGLRYLVALRCFVNQPKSDALARLKYRDMLWAYHSTSQEVLQGALTQAYDGQLTWAAARASGIFMWLRSPAELRAVAEQVARAQYMAGNDRDPVKCSLFYYALGKHRLVQNLWRQAAWHPEQQKMLAFLAKDFSEERWRTAALKNAFALLSQRRFEFAATFFMLGDSLGDAVNVCVRNLDDLPLALALARVREGRDDGPVFSELLRRRVLPLAFEQGYRWLASWAFWLLKRRDLAVRVILVPFTELLADADVAAMLPADAKAGDGHYADASLAILFGQLKHKSLQTLRGTATISEQLERDFVLHINRVLRSQGCQALGLALLRNWSFDPPDLGSAAAPPAPSTVLAPPPAAAASSDIAADLFSALYIDTASEAPLARSPPASPPAVRRRSSLMRRASRVIDDSELVAQSLRAPQAAVHEEPAPVAAATTAKAEPPVEEQPSKPTPTAPPPRLPTMLKSSNAATQQQGAQEFSFDSFGF